MTNQTNGNTLMIQGRIVWGIGASLFEGRQKKDYNTNQPIIGADGNPAVEYGFGLAIPKLDQNGQNSEEFTKVWNALHQEAFTLFPNGQIPPGFAMKYKDGDSIDDKGKPFADREGYAGHIVLAATTQIPIKWFKFEGGNNILVSSGFKVGDYVNAQINIKAHPAKGQGKAGLYINPLAVQFIQPGPEIINTPSGDQIFGQQAPAYAGQALPDTAPQMPNMAPQAPATAAPVAPQMPGQAPAPQAPVAPQADPHYGVLPNQLQPGQAPAPQAPMGNAPAQPVAPTPTQPSQAPATPNPQVNTYAQPAAPSNGLPQAMPQAPAAPQMPQMP